MRDDHPWRKYETDRVWNLTDIIPFGKEWGEQTQPFTLFEEDAPPMGVGSHLLSHVITQISTAWHALRQRHGHTPVQTLDAVAMAMQWGPKTPPKPLAVQPALSLCPGFERKGNVFKLMIEANLSRFKFYHSGRTYTSRFLEPDRHWGQGHLTLRFNITPPYGTQDSTETHLYQRGLARYGKPLQTSYVSLPALARCTVAQQMALVERDTRLATHQFTEYLLGPYSQKIGQLQRDFA
jgi:hypothetical protein